MCQSLIFTFRCSFKTLILTMSNRNSPANSPNKVKECFKHNLFLLLPDADQAAWVCRSSCTEQLVHSCKPCLFESTASSPRPNPEPEGHLCSCVSLSPALLVLIAAERDGEVIMRVWQGLVERKVLNRASERERERVRRDLSALARIHAGQQKEVVHAEWGSNPISWHFCIYTKGSLFC